MHEKSNRILDTLKDSEVFERFEAFSSNHSFFLEKIMNHSEVDIIFEFWKNKASFEWLVVLAKNHKSLLESVLKHNGFVMLSVESTERDLPLLKKIVSTFEVLEKKLSRSFRKYIKPLFPFQCKG